MAIPQTPSPLSNVVSSKTYNALWYQDTGDTSEVAISKATAKAAADGAPFVYIPAALFPYNIGLVTTNPAVSYVQESSVLAGYGTPEGVYAAPVGWLYQQLDTADLWQKATGTGTTGWVEIVSGALITNVNNINSVVNRFQEYRVLAVATSVTTLNDGSVFDTRLPVIARFGQSLETTSGGFQRYSSTNQLIYRQVDGRRCISAETTAIPNPNVGYCFRPFGGTPLFPVAEPRASFGTTTSSALLAPPPMAVSIMAWCRKKAGGDSSSARFTFGFGDLTITTPSRRQARCGLIGDGSGGYRFGSVNCPDAFAGGAGDNADNDIDANAVQPAELTNANLSTNWFHVRLKMIPPTPTSGAKWGAYLNGVLVATFTDTSVNFPRGAQGTSNDFARIEAQLVNFGNTASVVPNLVISDLRLWIEDDLTLV